MFSKSYYYIGTGEQTKMYTLRYVSAEKRGEFDYEYDHYCGNLSTDKDKAISVAKMRVGDTPLKTDYIPTLEEIRRRKHDEVEAGRIASEREFERIQGEREAYFLDVIDTGIFPFGMYKGEKFENTDKGYVHFIKNLDDVEWKVMKYLIQVLNNKFENLELPNPNGEYYGTPKTRSKGMSGIVIESFQFETYYGYKTIEKIILDSGELLVAFTDGNNLQKFDKIVFDAYIKAHDKYDGENQTQINRIKVIEKN